MKSNVKIIALLAVAIAVFISPALGQINVLRSNQLARVFNQLHEVDFETLPSTSDDLPNPLRIGGLTFTDPAPTFQSGTCSSPTCEPDPDHPADPGNPESTPGRANIAIGLNNTATISFAQPRRIVVLDLQGNGTNRFTFRFTDARGRRRIVVARTDEFATTLVPVSSAAGIRKIELLSGAGPLSLARVLFSDPVPRYTPIPNRGMNWRIRR